MHVLPLCSGKTKLAALRFPQGKHSGRYSTSSARLDLSAEFKIPEDHVYPDDRPGSEPAAMILVDVRDVLLYKTIDYLDLEGLGWGRRGSGRAQEIYS
jgi:hypothetical protein